MVNILLTYEWLTAQHRSSTVPILVNIDNKVLLCPEYRWNRNYFWNNRSLILGRGKHLKLDNNISFDGWNDNWQIWLAG